MALPLPTEVHEIPGDTDPREALRQAAALIAFAEQYKEIFYIYQLQSLRIARERLEAITRSDKVNDFE